MANQWQKIALRNKARMTKAAQESFIAASQSMIFKSPKDKGTFINNWFTEINGVSTKFDDSADKSGGRSAASTVSNGRRIEIGDSISCVNNLPYNIKLEYGYSEQAPQGMVRITAAEWPNIVAKIAKGIK